MILSFARQNVYNFCVKLDETWLPSHSQQYREAYHPAYRVLYKEFRNHGCQHRMKAREPDEIDE